MKNSKILVTGGAGYIGSHVVRQLGERGELVVTLDNLSTGFEAAVTAGELVIGDTGDAALLERLFSAHRIETVMHFAAHTIVPESVADPLGYYHNNTVKSRALMAAAVEAGVGQFIFSSTAAVYGTPKQNPVAEDAPTVPESPYGSSKLMTEIMLADTARAHDFRYVALRYFNVAGADPQGRTGQSTKGATHLIKVACETALGKRARMDVFGTDYPTPDGTCLRDYVHVSDLADAHVRALDRLAQGAPSTAYNLGTGRPHSVRDVIRAVERATGRAVPWSLASRRPGDPAALYAAPGRARAELDWTPRHPDLDAIVHTAWTWHQAHPQGYGSRHCE